MANTLTLIETQTLTSGNASITFSSIPNNYADLYLACSLRGDKTGFNDYIKIQFNNDTTSGNYIGQIALFGSTIVGVSDVISTTFATASKSFYGGEIPGTTVIANNFSITSIYISDYSGANYKNYISSSGIVGNSNTGYQSYANGKWTSTSAISTIKLETAGGSNLITNCSVSLYGISK